MGSVQVEEEDQIEKKDFKIFGKNISDIPCFRNSFICGICTGVAGGLITFMFTSKALVSTHTAFTSLWIGVFAYWLPCRYKFETNMLLGEKIKKMYKMSRENEQEEDSESASTDSSKKNPSAEK